MSKIAIIGATGYAGGHIQAEALARGHQVIAVSRNPPSDPTEGVEIRSGSIDDPALLDSVFADADVVIVATHGSLDGQPFLVHLVPSLLAAARAHSTRLGFVGGAGSLQVSPGGPRLIDTPEFPAEYKPEASSHAQVLDALRADESDAEWFYVSPAATFGSYNPGARKGSFRVGDDVLLTDSDGNSHISGADFAIAILDEIENPAHRRARFTVAY
jgi:putative NADH-flavin reductase